MDGKPHESSPQDTIIKIEVSEITYRDQCFKETGKKGGKFWKDRKLLDSRLPGDLIAELPACALCCPLLWPLVAPWLLWIFSYYPSTTW